MAVNKVEINGETALDLTADTVTPESLLAGVTAHNAAGESIVGVSSGGGEQLIVTFTYDSTTKTYSSDKTLSEIKAAYTNKVDIIAYDDIFRYYLARVTASDATFVSWNAYISNPTYIRILCLTRLDVTSGGFACITPDADVDLDSRCAHSVGAVPGTCWYLLPNTNGGYNISDKPDTLSVLSLLRWGPLFSQPDKYHLCVLYQGKIYEKASLTAVNDAEPLHGKFVCMGYETTGVICRVLSVDASGILSGTASVAVSEEIFDVTTTKRTE